MAKIVYGYGALTRHGEAAPFVRTRPAPFGDVSIEHGYHMGGFGGLQLGRYDFVFADVPAAGRSEGDVYSQAPYLIPITVDVGIDEIAMKALALEISYEQAKTADAAMAQAVNNTNTQVAMFAAKLVEAMAKSPGASAALKSDADSWLQQSSLFQDLGNQIVSGVLPVSRYPEWQALGLKIEENGNDLANTLGLPTFTLSGTLAGPGLPKALDWLKWIAYAAAAVAVVYVGSKVVGVAGHFAGYGGRNRRRRSRR